MRASAVSVAEAERRTLEKQTVFGDHWTHSEVFVLKAIVGAEHREINNLEEFLRNSRIGDYFFSPSEVTDHSYDPASSAEGTLYAFVKR